MNIGTRRALFASRMAIFTLFCGSWPVFAALSPLEQAPPQSSQSVFSSRDVLDSSLNLRVRLERTKSHFIPISGVDLHFRSGTGLVLSGYRAVRAAWSNGHWAIIDRDQGKTLARVRAREFEVSGQNLRVNLKSVPDHISLLASPSGEIDLIATLGLESYLLGVLPSEMPAGWPLEALKAQAVAARTFALYRRELRNKEGAPFHLESTVMDQVFSYPLVSERLGSERSQALDEKRKNVERAIRETRGVILLDNKTQPFSAYFHADCGGQTEEPGVIWGGGADIGTTKDQACPLSPRAKWSLKLSHAEVEASFRRSLGLKRSSGDAPALVALAEGERTPSGRLRTLNLRWSDGRSTRLSGHQFRKALGFDRLKSTNFRIQRQAGSIYSFTGQGHGHGVGMCQWGARHLALNGKGYREILSHYYPKASFSETKTTYIETGFKSQETL